MKIKLAILATCLMGAGAWMVLDSGLNEIPVAQQQEDLPGWFKDQHGTGVEDVEEVSGLTGNYPKYLTTEDAVKDLAENPRPELDQEDAHDAKAEAWAKVDMEQLRSEIPDNMFWTMAMPTTDEAVLEQRKQIRDDLALQETKMTARYADESEIREYYSYQQRLSEDYVQAVTLILNKYGSVLPEEDYSGQTLARNMHLAKLQEMPLLMTRALEQRQEFIEERDQWLADKSAYQAKQEALAAEANRALGKI